jgi:5-methylcytosine-specific restriction endonuclease McrA
MRYHYTTKTFISFANDYNLIAPDFQRIPDQSHLKEIIDEYERTWLSVRVIPFYGSLIVCQYNQKNYLIDGQHRYLAMKYMNDKYGSDPLLSIQTIECRTSKEMNEHFKKVNSNLDCPDYILDCDNKNKKEVLEEVKKEIEKRYKKYISKSQVPRFPNINLDMWLNYINITPWFYKNGMSFEQVWKQIEKLNEDCKNYFKSHNSICYQTIIEKDIINSFYCCSIKYWNKANKDIIIENNEMEMKPKKEKRSSKMRNDVWNSYIGKKIGETECLCCGIQIIEKGTSSYHCGHIIPESKGGENTIENLRPICSDCNLSMSDMNMLEFMKVNGYKGNREYPIYKSDKIEKIDITKE